MFVHYLVHENGAPQRKGEIFSSGRIETASVTVNHGASRVPEGLGFPFITSLSADRLFKFSLGFAIAIACLLVGSADLMGQGEESEDSQMVYPSSASDVEGAEGQSELYEDLMPDKGFGVGMSVTILGYLVIIGGMCVAAWYLFKRGVIRKPFSSSEGKLKVAESRMLGNRQYIMVVEYEDKKILLGVGPGKIDYLTSLDGYKSDFPKIEPEVERGPVRELA